jgi:Tol biopolymer transport system component
VRGQSDVWRFPVTGSALENARAGERVTRQTGLLQTVSVSPDESEIVYLSDAGGHANVWVARTVDGVARPITPLVNELGVWDLEVRVATPEDGPSRLIGRVPGIRVPSAAVDFQPVPSPDGAWLAVALRDGSTTNLWALSTDTGEWRQLTDFADRNVVIARRIAWSRDGASLYASVSDIDSDIVMLSGIIDP